MLGSVTLNLAGLSDNITDNSSTTHDSTDLSYTDPVIHIIIAPEILNPLGYNDTSQIPEKLLVQIIRSYNVPAVRGADGDYYCYINADSPKAAVNLIGTDRICAEEEYVDLTHPPSD